MQDFVGRVKQLLAESGDVPLHRLFNVAGIDKSGRSRHDTKDEIMRVNYLHTVLLTRLLLDRPGLTRPPFRSVVLPQVLVVGSVSGCGRNLPPELRLCLLDVDRDKVGFDDLAKIAEDYTHASSSLSSSLSSSASALDNGSSSPLGGRQGSSPRAAYVLSKFLLHAASEVIARQWQGLVLCNSLCPGACRTAMNSSARHAPEHGAELILDTLASGRSGPSSARARRQTGGYLFLLLLFFLPLFFFFSASPSPSPSGLLVIQGEKFPPSSAEAASILLFSALLYSSRPHRGVSLPLSLPFPACLSGLSDGRSKV